jgi:nucleotide-binding universal stress UspA family protein
MSDSISVLRKTVLAGFDGSAVARGAAVWAAGEAATRGWPLVLARSFERPLRVGEFTWTPVGLSPDDARAWHCGQSLRVLGDQCRITHPELEVSTTTRAGHPGHVLAALAVEVDAGLVVLGSKGHGPFARLVLGSTAADLVHLLDRPVAVVRGPVTTGPVVLGLAGTDTDGQAIEFAFEAAARHNCPLLAVHGDHHMRAPDVLEQVLAPWQERYPSVPVRTEVVRDKPASALVERSQAATMLVVGSHHHNAAHRALRGSISHATLYHATCPVAVVPAGHHTPTPQPKQAAVR